MERRVPLVLIAEGDRELKNLLSTYLWRRGIHVLLASDGGEALAVLESIDIDVLLTDVCLPVLNGIDLVAWVRHHRPHVFPLVIVEHPKRSLGQSALRQGALKCLVKPVEPLEIFQIIKRSSTETLGAGDLRDFELLDYLYNLLKLRRQVLIELISLDAKLGRIFVEGGSIKHAEYGDLKGEEALFACAEQRRGSYIVIPGTSPVKQTIVETSDVLLVRAVRRRFRDEKITWDEYRIELRNRASLDGPATRAQSREIGEWGPD